MSPLSIVLPALLLLALVVAVIASRGSLRRNRFFGIRVPAAMRSDAAWVTAHRASVLPAALGFVVTSALGVVQGLTTESALRYAVVAAFAVSVALILIVANRAAKS